MKKRISLDSVVNIPGDIRTIHRSEGILYVARNNPSFMFLSNMESFIFEQLIKNKTIRQAAENIAKRNNFSTLLIEESTKSLLNKIEHSGFYKNNSNPQERTWPLHLYLTNECNLKCRMCYKNAGIAKPNELSTEEILRLIDNFSEQGESSVVLSGGEPLKHKDFFFIVEYIKQKNHKVSVVSNGLLIHSKSDVERIVSLVDFFQISLDGASEKFNDYYRGKGTYPKILDKINLFSNTNFLLNVGMIVSDYNFEDIYNNLGSLVNRLENKNLKINVSNIIDFGRGAYCLNKGTRDLVHKIIRKVKGEGIHTKEWEVLNVKTYDCGFARSITVDSDGSVYYCPVTHPFTDSNINIRTTSFQDVLTYFKEINKSVSVENMLLCVDCELTYLCGGGCRIENMRKTGSYTGQGACNLSRRNIIYDEMILMREAV